MPLNVLQHAGFYYHLAAVCAVERRERFRAVSRALEDAGQGAASSPAVAHEMKVDHGEIIIEVRYFPFSHFLVKADLVDSSALHQSLRVLQSEPSEEHDLLHCRSDRFRPSREREGRHGFPVRLLTSRFSPSLLTFILTITSSSQLP